MDNLSLRPPTAPGSTPTQKKKGFFSKLFKRKERDDSVTDTSMTDSPTESGDEFNLDDIRRRIGLDENENAPAEAPEVPAAPVEPEAEAPPTEKAPAPEPATPDAQPEEKLEEKPEEKSSEAFEERSEFLDFAPNPIKEGASPEPVGFDEPRDEPRNEPSGNDEPSEPSFSEEPVAPDEPPRFDEAPEQEQEAEHAPQESSPWTEETAPAAEAEENKTTAPTTEPESETSPFAAEALTEHQDDLDELYKELTNKRVELADDEQVDKDLDELDRLHDELAEHERTTHDELDEFRGLDEELAELEELHRELEAAQVAQGILKHEGASYNAVDKEMPRHHKEVEKALSGIKKKHEQLDRQLEKALLHNRTDVPEWKYQKKEVHPDNFFKLKNGQEIKNLKDLMDAIAFIDDETFAHHVSEEKNDFAAWVQHILEEEKLAEQIRNKTAREQLLKILHDHEKGVFKELEKQEKQIEKDIARKEKKVSKVHELEQKLEKLAKELAEKSAELAEMRGKHGEKIKQSLDHELTNIVSEERERLDKIETGFSDREQGLQKMSKTLAQKEARIQSREEHVLKQEEIIKKKNKDIDEREMKLERDLKESKKLLSEAEEIKKLKEAAEAARTENKKILAENKKAAKEAAKKLSLLKGQEKRLTTAKAKFQKEKGPIMALRKELTKRERALKKREASLERNRGKLSKERERMVAERKEAKELVKKELAPLDEKRKEISKMLDELSEKTKLNEDSFRRAKELRKSIEEEKRIIEQKQKRMEKRTLKEYVESKVDDTLAGEETKPTVPDVKQISNIQLYKLIDQCKSALDQKQIAEARRTYNSLRNEFGRAKLASHEKSILYNAIRELYDDIHLAMLNQ